MTMWLRVRYLPSGSDSPRAVSGESCRLPSARCHISSPEGVEEVTRARQEGRTLLVNPARITLYWIPISSKNRYSGEVFTADPRSGKPERQWENCLTVKSTAWFPTTHHAPGNESRQHHGSMGRYCRSAKCMDVMFDEAVQKRGMSLPMLAN